MARSNRKRPAPVTPAPSPAVAVAAPALTAEMYDAVNDDVVGALLDANEATILALDGFAAPTSRQEAVALLVRANIAPPPAADSVAPAPDVVANAPADEEPVAVAATEEIPPAAAHEDVAPEIAVVAPPVSPAPAPAPEAVDGLGALLNMLALPPDPEAPDSPSGRPMRFSDRHPEVRLSPEQALLQERIFLILQARGQVIRRRGEVYAWLLDQVAALL